MRSLEVEFDSLYLAGLTLKSSPLLLNFHANVTPIGSAETRHFTRTASLTEAPTMVGSELWHTGASGEQRDIIKQTIIIELPIMYIRYT